MLNLINRHSYVAELKKLHQQSQPQLLALYGRRRVGKTFLIRYCFQQSDTDYMEVTGLTDGSMHQQLTIFAKALAQSYFNDAPLATPSDWFAAFELLTTQLIQRSSNKPQVLFLDELPWLATKRSGMLAALDHYWNTKWSHLKNLTVVVCGSAASWMLDKIINAKGGLHNRLTKIIHLKPFTLQETKQFLLAKKLRVSHKNILDIYLVMGGIPYYLQQLEAGKSIIQNINDLYFKEDGLLYSEFPRLFRSLFNLSEINLRIIRAIAQHRYGLTRQQIIQKTRIPSGSNLNNRLYELISAGFINRYVPYGNTKKEMFFRVMDEYTLFYLHWIEPQLQTGHTFSQNHWQIESKTPQWQSWAGYAFEGVCMKHHEQIRKVLQLDQIGCKVSSWRYITAAKSSTSGAQIDLLFDRNDQAITLCEIKYSENTFILDKVTAKNLLHKRDSFIEHTKTKKQVFLAFVSTMGLKPGIWNDEVIDAEVKLDELFE